MKFAVFGRVISSQRYQIVFYIITEPVPSNTIYTYMFDVFIDLMEMFDFVFDLKVVKG